MVLDAPPLPFEIEYLWGYFNELSQGITPGGFGAPVATWDNIGWWARLVDVVLEPWESRMLALLSVMRANALAAESKKKPKADGRRKA